MASKDTDLSPFALRSPLLPPSEGGNRLANATETGIASGTETTHFTLTVDDEVERRTGQTSGLRRLPAFPLPEVGHLVQTEADENRKHSSASEARQTRAVLRTPDAQLLCCAPSDQRKGHSTVVHKPREPIDLLTHALRNYIITTAEPNNQTYSSRTTFHPHGMCLDSLTYVRLREFYLRQQALRPLTGLSAKRKSQALRTTPLQTVSVPLLQDDFYLNLLDWSVSGCLAVGAQDQVVIWKPRLDELNASSCDAFSDGVTNVPPPPSMDSCSRCRTGSIRDIEPRRVETIPSDAVVLQFPQGQALSVEGSLNSQDSNNSLMGSSVSDTSSTSITSVSWNPTDVTLLGVGYRSGHVVLWDVQKSMPVRVFKYHEHRVGSMDWLGSNLLSTGSRDKSIVHHDLRIHSRSAFRWEAHKQEVRREPSTSHCFSKRPRSRSRSFGKVCGLEWAPTHCGLEGALASGGNDNNVFIWKLGYNQPLLKLSEHSAAVKALSWSPHKAGILATGGGTNDRSLRLWDTSQPPTADAFSDPQDPQPSCRLLHCFDSGSQICNTLWSPRAPQILTTHGFTLNEMNLWDVALDDADGDAADRTSGVYGGASSRDLLIPGAVPSFAAPYGSRSNSDVDGPHNSRFSSAEGSGCSGRLVLKRYNIKQQGARVLYLTMHPMTHVVATGAGDKTVQFWNVLC